jgi:ribonuclease-3
MAFRHKSMAVEVRNGFKNSNERLEYLGDAIIGAVVAEFVFKKFPYKEEGFLTEMRSKMVSRDSLNKLSQKIGLAVLIQSPDINSAGKSVYGNAFEALVGAIYLDKGYNTARRFITDRIIKFHIDVDLLESTEINFKSKIINWGQREKKTVVFELMEEEIQDKGRKLMKVRVLIDGIEYGTGKDFNKRKAEQTAAEATCKSLNL